MEEEERVSLICIRGVFGLHRVEKKKVCMHVMFTLSTVVPVVTAGSAEGHYRLSSEGPHSTTERRCGQL